MTRRVLVLPLAAVVLAAPAAATAHTALETVTPAEGARMANPPTAVVARYGEPLAEVVDAAVTVDGTAIAGVRARLAPGDASTVRIPLPASARSGRFAVTWNVRGADSHVLDGAVAFTVARPTLRADLRRIAAALDEAAAALRTTGT